MEDKEEIRRIRFFMSQSATFSLYYSRLKQILDNSIKINNLNDAIELFNIKKYIDTGVFFDTLPPQINDTYISIVKKIPGQIASYLMNVEYCSTDLANLKGTYKVDFWEIITDYNLFSNWDSQYFIELSKTIGIGILLKHKKLISKFNKEISERLIYEIDITAELIIESYFITNYRNLDIHFPSNFSNAKMELVIQKYINDSKYPNLNYLRALLLNQNAGLVLSTKTKLLARKKCEAIENDFYKNSSPTLVRNLGVEFSPNQTNQYEIKNDYENFTTIFSYSLNWIQDHLDSNLILTNFKNLFGFMDTQNRITLINKQSTKLLFEKYIFPNYIGSYAPSNSFSDMLALEKMQMAGYYHILKRNRIRLEEVLKSFFEEGLPSMFSINGFKMDIPSPESNYLEKCRTILPEIDKILKQFNILVEDGAVDQELLQMESSPIAIDNVKSFINRKYFVSVNGKADVQQAIDSLFSEQCMLHYVQRIEKNYKSFFSLINQEVITEKDYEGIPVIIPQLKWLINNSFIAVETDGRLIATERASILYDLYLNETICFWYHSRANQEIIENLEAQGFLKCEELLFAKSEREMFNYLLNQKTFTDNLHLRNDYIHGTQPGISPEDPIHEENYMLFLVIIVDIILKIAEELYLRNC